MVFIIFQLLLLFSLFLCLAALPSSRFLRGIIAFLGVLAIGFQLVSVLIRNSLIDYKFYAHCKIDIAKTAESFFSDQFVVVLGVAAVSGLVIYLLSGWLNRRVHPLGWMVWIAAAAMGLMSISGGIVNNLQSIVKIHFAQQKIFRDALDNSGIENYTLKKEIKAEPGKNIIVIFMRSVEPVFLVDKLAEISPNLRRMKEEMTFYPMTQNLGGDFSIGAIYTYMTGIPMYFKNHGNDIFETVTDFELTSVGDVLNEAGYHQEYLAGNPSFAGTDVMLQLMGIEVKSEQDYDPSYYVHPWGLHDRDLFDIVEGELDRLYEQQQPFAYYVSTVSTHAVDGIYDERVLEDVAPQASKLELMAAALDHRIGQLIATLKAKGQLENTAIYILPDHLLMGSSSQVMENFADPRGFFLLTNTAPVDYPNGTTINQTDVPGILLQGAGVKHNMTILADQMNEDPVSWLENNKLQLLQLNESALMRLEKKDLVQIDNGDEFELNDAQLRLVSRSWKDDNDGKPSYIFDGKEQLVKPERGISLITSLADEFEVETFDVYASVGQVDSLIERLEQLREANAATWLLAHDSVGDHLEKRRRALQELGYEILSRQKGRRAYVAYARHGYVSEKTDAKTVNMTFARTRAQPERSAQ